jgi:general secretion pathway protein A
VTEVTTEVTIEALHGVASPRETENTEEAVIALEASNAPPAAEKPVAPDLLSFHKLKQQPFDVTPDPAFLYLSQSHREALTSLKDGIEHLRGFMMLVADPGMGKTTLLNRLMEELSESARIVFLFQTQCTSRELLCYILNELEVDHTGMDVVAMHRALNQALLEEMLRGRRFVLIVDEAQNLQEPVLETIRLLSDFETTHSKLIQIVLAGQPQLADTLMSDSLVQLRQRVAILAKLKSLSSADLKEYVEHRLRYAGCSDRVIFSSDALEQIAEKSQGVPRSVNNLCFNALFEAFHRGQEIVNADIVKEVAAKLNLESLVPRPALTAASQKAAPQTESIDTALLVRALAAALASGPNAKTNAEPRIGPEANASVVLTGNLMDKFRSQSSAKQHECRVQVSLERDASLGLPVADRYYCTTLYLSDEQAAPLSKGKPVRIKIEQD